MISTLDGNPIQELRLYVPHQGAWFADLSLTEAPSIGDAVEIAVGETSLSGTVTESGTRGNQLRCRVVAGTAGWSDDLSPKAYHNDAGVKALLVAQDAARGVGETLGSFVPSEERVGSYFIRRAGPASRVLERAAGGRPWWVDYDGITHVGPRESLELFEGGYEVVDYDARTGVVTLHVEDLGVDGVAIGGVLRAGLDAPQTIRDLEVVVTEGESIVYAWCAGGESARGPILDPLVSIVEGVLERRLLGKYRYRVIRMSGDRVELQSVRRRVGLPDLLPVSMWPGFAGVHAELAGGAEVLVEFIEGDAAQPIITHFAGKDGVGFVPESIAIAEGTKGAARVDDDVNAGTVTGSNSGGAVTFVYTPAGGGSPVTGTTLSLTGGKITSGSSKVRIG